MVDNQPSWDPHTRPHDDPSQITKEQWEAGLAAAQGTLLRLSQLWGFDRTCVRRHCNRQGVERDKTRRIAEHRDRPPPALGPIVPLRNPALTFDDLKDYPKNPEELLDFVERACEINKAYDTAQRVVPAHIETDKPVGVCIRGDWHGGNRNTQHALLRKHNQLIRDTPGLFTAELGDFCDAFIKPNMQDGQQEAVVNVKLQRHLVWAHYRMFLVGKVIGDVTGQHDYWASQLAAFDPVEWLSHDFQIPYLKHGGLIKLMVGEVEYQLHVRHKARGNSQWNPTHSNVRELYFGDGDYDVVAHADKHVWGIQELQYKNRPRALVRPGTYKPHDNYSDSHGFGESQATMPVVLFWPDRPHIEVIRDIALAAEILAVWHGG